MTTPGQEQGRTGARRAGRREAVRVTASRRATAEPGAASPDLVRAALAGLTHDDQRLLWLKYVDRAGDLTVARLLGVSASTVPWRLRAAERRLSAGFAATLARAAEGTDDACGDTLASLGAYVQHRLAGPARSVLESHLFGCPDCMRAFTDVRQARWALRDAAPLLLGGGAGLSAAAGPVVLGAAPAGGAGGVLAALGGGAGMGSALAALRGVAESVRGAVPAASGTTWALGGASAGVVLVAGVAATVMLSADTQSVEDGPEPSDVVAAQPDLRVSSGGVPPLVPVDGGVESPPPTTTPEAAAPGAMRRVDGEAISPPTTGAVPGAGLPESDAAAPPSPPPPSPPPSSVEAGAVEQVEQVETPQVEPDESAPSDLAETPPAEPDETAPTKPVETAAPHPVVPPWPVPPPLWMPGFPPVWGPPPSPVWVPPVPAPGPAATVEVHGAGLIHQHEPQPWHGDPGSAIVPGEGAQTGRAPAAGDAIWQWTETSG